MNALLTGLGVPPELQVFFHATKELSFDYGDDSEHFGNDFYKVPTTSNLWVGGNLNAFRVIITYSVMEAIAFLTINRHRFQRLEQLALIAIGNRLHEDQSSWIRENFQGRQFILVFGKDILGHLTDIKITAGIKNIAIRIFHSGDVIRIFKGNKEHVFNQEQISLHAFQQAFGIRPRFRTGKPSRSLTFLEQLKHDKER